MKRVILFIKSILMAMKNNFKKKTVVDENYVFENKFTIDIPKKDNAGEDAPPLLVVSNNQQRCVVGVFDGMGGSGSMQYEENGEIHTGAYFASRAARDTVGDFFKERLNGEKFELSENDIKSLESSIIDGLNEKLKNQKYEQSRIKSSLIRTFPTTMAVGVGVIFPHENNMKIKVLWAGDSRVYLLSPEKGLVQLTKDDLKLNNDPFQNIENDSPLSNMLYLDGKFEINEREIPKAVLVSTVLFAATDGCFGFFPTPMHFEELLLQTMQISNSFEEWKEQISEKLKAVSGDDCSLSLVRLSKPNTDFTESFNSRNTTLTQEYMKAINDTEEKLAEAKAEIEQIEQERKDAYKSSWEKYKLINYPYFNKDKK